MRATHAALLEGARDVYVDAVHGDDLYEDWLVGSVELPFKTLAAAHVAVTNSLATNVSGKAVIWVSDGRFDQNVPIALAAGESIVGMGKDRTFVNLKGCSLAAGQSALLVSHADNLLSSLCVTGLVSGAGITSKSAKPRALTVTAGRVEHCRSAYHILEDNGGDGCGMYVTGGTVQFCEIDHNISNAMYPYGVGVHMTGGSLTDCDIYQNVGSAVRDVRGNGIYLNGVSASVSRCRIHANGVDKNEVTELSNGGVWIERGTLQNSLVYGNFGGRATLGGGIHNKGGTVRYCTIYGNKAYGDTTGASGYTQAGGTAMNNIVIGNYMPGAVVSGGTCQTNLLDAAVAGYPLNFVTDDAGFVDAAAADFHIAYMESLAVGKGASIGEVATDFDGRTRDPAMPTIGAYEFVTAAGEFAVRIRAEQVEWPEGSSPRVELVTSGVYEPEMMEITWFLDGAEVPAAANRRELEFADARLGRHTVKVVVAYEGQTQADEKTDIFAVLPRKVYVNSTGDGTFPFATPATGTNSINVALTALWKANDETTVVDVDEGTYRLSDVVALQFPVAIVGRGREKTHVCGLDVKSRLVTLDNALARLRGLTLTNSVLNGGLEIKSGVADDCRFIRCDSTEYGGRGAGVKVVGGALLNSEIVDCTMDAYTGIGGGCAVVGKTAVVSNCIIRSCCAHCGTREPASHGGAGVYANNGLMTHCRILDCCETTNKYGTGVAVRSVNGTLDTSNFVLRNCLIAGCRSCSAPAVVLTGGTMENCTMTDNALPDGVAAVSCTGGGRVRNCVIWNGDADVEATDGSVSYSCYANATEGENGNTAASPLFRGLLEGEYKISSKAKAFRAGEVRPWMTEATDLLGNPRLTNGEVDMGCYQVGWDPGLMLLVR